MLPSFRKYIASWESEYGAPAVIEISACRPFDPAGNVLGRSKKPRPLRASSSSQQPEGSLARWIHRARTNSGRLPSAAFIWQLRRGSHCSVSYKLDIVRCGADKLDARLDQPH